MCCINPAQDLPSPTCGRIYQETGIPTLYPQFLSSRNSTLSNIVLKKVNGRMYKQLTYEFSIQSKKVVRKSLQKTNILTATRHQTTQHLPTVNNVQKSLAYFETPHQKWNTLTRSSFAMEIQKRFVNIIFDCYEFDYNCSIWTFTILVRSS